MPAAGLAYRVVGVLLALGGFKGAVLESPWRKDSVFCVLSLWKRLKVRLVLLLSSLPNSTCVSLRRLGRCTCLYSWFLLIRFCLFVCCFLFRVIWISCVFPQIGLAYWKHPNLLQPWLRYNAIFTVLVCLSADWTGTPVPLLTLAFSEFALESTGTFLAVPSVLLSANWTGSHYLLHCIPDPFPFFPPLFNFSLRRSLRYSPRHIYLYLFVLCQGLSPPFPSRSQIDRVWIGQESPRTLTSS